MSLSASNSAEDLVVVVEPRLERRILALILAVALLLRLYRLGDNSLWLDEINIARSAFGDGNLLASFGLPQATHPLGYLWLIRLVSQLGQDEWLLRLPAALFSVAGVFAIWALGRTMFSPVVGLVAAFLLAISRLHVTYGQEVHSYALFATLSIVMVWALYRAAQRQLRDRVGGDLAGRQQVAGNWLSLWWPFILATVANLYIHYYAFFPTALTVVAFPLFLLDVGGRPVVQLWRDPVRRRAAKGFLLALMAVLLLYLPQLLFGLSPALRHAGVKTAALASGAAAPRFEIGWHLLTETLLAFTTARENWWLDPLFFSALLLFVVTGLAWLFWKRRALAVFVLTWLLLPLPAIMLFAQRVGISFSPRRLLYALPVFLLTAAVGITALAWLGGRLWDHLAHRRLRGDSSAIAQVLARLTPAVITVAILVVAGLAVVKGAMDPLTAYYRTPKQDWRTLADTLAYRAQPDDTVAALPRAANLASWYYDGPLKIVAEEEIPDLLALCDTSDHLFLVSEEPSSLARPESVTWLSANFVEVPLKLIRLWYHSCQPDDWYGRGAGILFELSRRPGMSNPEFYEGYRRYAALVERQGFSAQAEEVPAASPGVATPVLTPAPAARSPITATAKPTATPPPVVPALSEAAPLPGDDLAGLLVYRTAAQADNALAQLQWAAYLAQQRAVDQAVVAFDQAVALDPQNWLAYALWAQALDAQGQKAAAQSVLEQGLAALPGDPALVGLLNQVQGQPEGEGGETSSALVEQGKLAIRERDWDAALAAGRQAVDQVPTREAYLLLGDAHRGAGQLQEALEAYRLATRLAPQFGVYHARQADVLVRLGSAQEGLDEALMAVALAPTQWESWLSLGRAYADLAADDGGQAAAAESALRETLQLAPPQAAGPRQILAEFYVAQDRPAAAIPLFQELIALNPGDRRTLQALAEAQAAAGRWDEAVVSYQALVEADPDDRQARMDLGAAQVETGQKTEAMTTYEAISARWPDFAWSLVRQGEVLEADGDFEGALDAYRRAVQLAPDNADVRFVLAHAFRRAGLVEEATAEFEAGLALDPQREAARQALEELRAGGP